MTGFDLSLLPLGPRFRGDVRPQKSRFHLIETRSGLALSRPLHLHVPVDEAHHALEHVAGLRKVRRVAWMPVGFDIVERDLAAGLAIGGDETLGLVAGE